MQLAHEFTQAPRRPSANDGSFAPRPMRAFDVEVRLLDGGITTLTTVARHRDAAIDHADAIFGDDIDGVKPKALA